MTRRVTIAAAVIGAMATAQGFGAERTTDQRARDLAAVVKFGDTKAKLNVMKAIAKLGVNARAAWPALIKAMGDDDRSVRLAATATLGQIRATSPEARAALTKASKGTDAELAAAAVEALKLIQRHIRLNPVTAVRELKIVLGFAQIGSESDWRAANTRSILAEAARRGTELVFSDAQQKQTNQIKAIRSFIARRVDVIAFSPVVETGWQDVLAEAKTAGIPVILCDRGVDVKDKSLYVTALASDFEAEGKRAAQWLAKKTGGKARIVVLKGSPGASVTAERHKGFTQIIAKHPGMKIIAMQIADFERAKGRRVMTDLLTAHGRKGIDAVFAHNDDMAMGAIQAMKAAGVKPGKDITIVSIDGVRAAFEAMVAGELNCTVECNPLIGKQLFAIIQHVLDGKKVPKFVAVKEGIFDQTTAAKAIKTRQY